MMKICQHYSINIVRNCQIDEVLISSVNWRFRSFNQSMIKAKSLSSLNKDTIWLAHQLTVFSRSDHWFTHIFINQSHEILQFIIKHYINSSLSQHFSASSYSILENFIFWRKKSVDFNSLKFQTSWFLNNKKSKIQKIQSDFLIAITHIFNHSYYLCWRSFETSVFLIISKINDEIFSSNFD